MSPLSQLDVSLRLTCLLDQGILFKKTTFFLSILSLVQKLIQTLEHNLKEV